MGGKAGFAWEKWDLHLVLTGCRGCIVAICCKDVVFFCYYVGVCLCAFAEFVCSVKRRPYNTETQSVVPRTNRFSYCLCEQFDSEQLIFKGYVSIQFQ